jgi:hypothetical protein
MFAQELAGVYSKPVLWSLSYCVLSCGGGRWKSSNSTSSNKTGQTIEASLRLAALTPASPNSGGSASKPRCGTSVLPERYHSHVV